MLQTSRVAIVEPELADLERIYASLGIPGHRIELLDGQVMVSPTMNRPHSWIVQRLQEALRGVSRSTAASCTPAWRYMLLPLWSGSSLTFGSAAGGAAVR